MQEKIATGQSMNLAVADAVAVGKQTDTKYILSRFIAYYDLGTMLQGLSLDDIKDVIKGE